VRHAPEALITLNKTPETVAKDIKDPDEMSSLELRDYINGLKARSVPPRVITRLNVALQNKLSMPFASLVFAVLGTPLGIRRQRSSAAMGVGLSLLILFAYYVLWHSMSIVGENGQCPAVVAAWTANVAALLTGFALTIKVSR
jgi:lipopolysaccharide export system permease protein